MDIVISNTSDKPLYEQITTQIKNLIIGGVLQEGDDLPSMRLLAKELRISVITTKRAYEELERNGFIVSVVGKGSFVARKNLELVREEILKTIESLLQDALVLAKGHGILMSEVASMLQLLGEEE